MKVIEDVEVIHKAISTTYHSTDQKALINCIGRRSNEHMQYVREEYKKRFGNDLIKEIESKISFKFKKLIVGLIKSYPEYRCEEIYNSINGIVTDKDSLIDFIIGNDHNKVKEFSQFFIDKYNLSLFDMIKGEVKEKDFANVLIKAIQTKRSSSVEEDMVEKDTEEIFKASKNQMMDFVLADILIKRSHDHLKNVSNKYKQLHNNTLEEIIMKETSGWFQKSLLACLDSPPVYWAKRVRHSLHSFEIDDTLLVRCFSQCSKPFLKEISNEYLDLFGSNLADDIQKEILGDYCELLITLLEITQGEKDQYK